MPLVQTRGAASAQGFGEFAQASAPIYIEEVFSTFLYTGNGSTQTITNNIDLSTKGGLVWLKGRSLGYSNYLFDTVRGAGNSIYSNLQIAQQTSATTLTAFGSTGFSLGSESDINESATTYVSWTFREQPKFFDIVTYTGTGSNTTIAHSLGAVPGCIMVKRTDTGGSPWAVYHRSLANTQYLVLNSTAAAATGATWWNSTTPTSSVFSVGTDATVNASGGTYVAYIFAHDAGGFGLTGTDNVVTCGGFTTDGSGNITVSLGYEPQWILLKTTGVVDAWYIYDTMRGITAIGAGGNAYNAGLSPNSSGAENTTTGGAWSINSTGFRHNGGFASRDWIYVAIRRGPMKVPTTGTKVFMPTTYTGDGNASIIIPTVLSPLDLMIVAKQVAATPKFVFTDRLRGSGTAEGSDSMRTLTSTSTAAESDSSLNGYYATVDFQTSVRLRGSSTNIFNTASAGYILYAFQRAPSFFDEVCYTGTGSATTFSHNLGVAPELYIVKGRSSATNWSVGSTSFTALQNLVLNDTAALDSSAQTWNSTYPTASVFSVGGSAQTNASAATYVAYLFATCAGVSKVGSYTGTGTTQTINCGFTAGSRFIMIKRTDSTGDWYVWDSARGIVAGNDPYLLFNSTAAEVTGTDYVDTANSGFEISSTAPAAINANGGNFIFLAIA